MSNTEAALNKLEILFVDPKDHPDDYIDEGVIRKLLSMHIDKASILLGDGQELTGTLEFFYDGEDYQIWHEVVTEEPGDEYLGIRFSLDEVADAFSALQKSRIDEVFMDKPHLQGPAKPKKSPLL